MINEYYVHESATIDKGAEIGQGTRIWHRCHIMGNVKIGKNCNIGENVFAEKGVILGDNVKVKNNVALYSGLECEADVFIGPNAVFTNVINPRSFIERKSEFKKTIIKKGATIGANATIVCGNQIGEYAFVGAGSVVTREVDPYTMVIGNPARFYSYVCKCGCKLNVELICTECGKRYRSGADKAIRPIDD